MSYEETLLNGLVDGAYSVINSINQVSFFGIGAFNWLLIFFVTSFVVELVRHIISGGNDGRK